MAEAGGGAVEGGVEDVVGAVEVEDGVAAGYVEGGGGVELEAVRGEVGGDAGVREERRRRDGEALGGGGDGGDGVGVVGGVEQEGAAGAPDFVGGVSAGGGGAEGVGNGGRAARGAGGERKGGDGA